MSSNYCSQPGLFDCIHNFAVAGANNELTEDHWNDFERLLQENDNAFRLYIEYMEESDLLRAVMDAMPEEDSPSQDAFFLEQQAPASALAPTFLSPILHGTVGYFSSGWPMAYLAATVILGIGLVIGAITHVSYPDKSVVSGQGPVVSKSNPQSLTPNPLFVGRITGMVDCQWVDPQTEAINSVHVPLGRRYALTYGLMEITYDTGAKVILQGPVTYKVESKNGGFLSVGKLTGRVEVESAKGFVIRTPTATVTDLGTEFGVEVNERGETASHVFRGVVKFQLTAADPSPEGKAVILHENESIRTGRNEAGKIVAVRPLSGEPHAFARHVTDGIKTLDVLDIVAGGNGITKRREQGIDPVTGFNEYAFQPGIRYGNREYHTTVQYKLIDGVFIPDGRSGAVVIDSAGHQFNGFPATGGDTFGPIWSRAATVNPDDPRVRDDYYWIYAVRSVSQYMPNQSGLLGMHANSGMTLNLQAMRKLYPGIRPIRFRAVAGVVDSRGVADIWVLVDGRLKFQRKQFCMNDGPVSVNIDIEPGSRFLTLASTDCGHRSCDWVVFGDPVLDMLPDSQQNTQDKR